MKKASILFLTTTLILTLGVSAMCARPLSVHDPSIIKDYNGKYYVFGSHITTAESDNLIDWGYVARGYKTEGNVHFGSLAETLKGSFKWAGMDDGDCKGGFAVWAPDVYYNPHYRWENGNLGAYMMYYSASSTYKRSCIGLAVSKEIEGPYTYVDTIIYSGFTKTGGVDENSNHSKKYDNTNLARLFEKGRVSGYKDDWGIDDYNNITYPNAIDPCVYETKDNKLYLAYGSWSGGIFTLQLNKETGLPIYPGFDSVTEGGNVVDRYFGTHIAGGKGWSGEGPFVYYDKETDFYYLQSSYDWLGTEGGYHIRMFRSKSPVGPFTDISGNNAVYGENHSEHGVKMFGNYKFSSMKNAYTSGGHSSALIDDNGERFVFYHTRFKGSDYFELRVHQMFMNEDGWVVIAPFKYTGDKISETGYSDEEITGIYEYINHGTGIAEGKKVNLPGMVQLKEDGTVTGAAEGTWTKNGKYVTMNVNGGVYKGVFFKQKDEEGHSKMTFSLVGGKNEAIWGVKSEIEKAEAPKEIMHITFDDEKGFSKVQRKNGENPVKAEDGTVLFENGALKLDGSYGIVLDGVNVTYSLTISFLMKPESFKSYTPIVAITENFTDEMQKWFSLTSFNNGKNAMLWSRNAENNQWLDSKTTIGYNLNKWQHITLSFDKNYLGTDADCIYVKMYVNGFCVGYGTVTNKIFTKDSKVYFGINPWDSCFTGLIDDIKVFDKTFTASAAMANYNTSTTK